MYKELLSIAILFGGFSTNSFAQAFAALNGTMAKASITLFKNNDLNFGSFISGTSSGTVVLNPVNSVRSATMGVTLASPNGATAGTFVVGGQNGTTYSLTLSTATIILTMTSSSNTISLTSITSHTSNLGASTTGRLIGGSDVITLGGTLNVPAGTPAGNYASASGALSVTVNYL